MQVKNRDIDQNTETQCKGEVQFFIAKQSTSTCNINNLLVESQREFVRDRPIKHELRIIVHCLVTPTGRY
jgi:hypothetical protein